jgi:hypothetical protein
MINNKYGDILKLSCLKTGIRVKGMEKITTDLSQNKQVSVGIGNGISQNKKEGYRSFGFGR